MAVSLTDPNVAQALQEKVNTTDDLGLGGLAPREVSAEFIDLVVGQSEFLNSIDRDDHPRRRMRVSKWDVEEFTRRGRGEGASTSRASVESDFVDFDAVEGSTLLPVTKEMVEESNTPDQFSDNAMEMLAKRFARDTQALAILGNEDASTPALGGRAPVDFLRQNDGFIQLAVDGGMATYANEDGSNVDQPMSQTTVEAMEERYPDEYLSEGEPVYVMSRTNFIHLRDQYGSFNSAAAFAAAMGQTDITPGGYDIVTPDYWPDNYAMLTPLENLHYGYFNEMETDVLTESDEIQDKKLEAKIRLWADDDFLIWNDRSGVLATDIDPSASA